MRRALMVVVALAAVSSAGSADRALAAQRCSEPVAGDWTDVSPAAAGMDGAKLRNAIDYATLNQAQAVRVYRYGCRVGAGLLGPVNAGQRFQSWSMAKSITALVFGRAMSRHLISPDDRLGSLVPVADADHGDLSLEQLLTMTSGLRWNGLRDYNILMPNRLQEALTVPVDKEPGAYWEYSQSGPALVAEATGQAVGEDFQQFAQRELFGPLGIEPGSWSWERDQAGHTQGFFDLHMTPDDFARFGELMRRGGTWRGKRLLSRRFVREAITPLPQNGCYGWLIWLNAAKPCVSPRVIDRPVSDERRFPTLPADAYQFAGLLGQLVTVFPSEGIVVARFGVDTGSIAGGSEWEEEFYRRVLGSITDKPVDFPPGASDATDVSREDVDRGFVESLARPDEVLAGELPPPLPPAGPARARASMLEPLSRRPSPKGVVRVRLVCPREWPSGLEPACAGRARLNGAKARRYTVAAGDSRKLRFALRPGFLEELQRQWSREVVVRSRNADQAGGVVASRTFTITSH